MKYFGDPDFGDKQHWDGRSRRLDASACQNCGVAAQWPSDSRALS